MKVGFTGWLIQLTVKIIPLHVQLHWTMSLFSLPHANFNWSHFHCVKLSGEHLRCSKSNKVTSVFLPVGNKRSNYSLIITAMAKNSSFVASTTITTQVCQNHTEKECRAIIGMYFFLIEKWERTLHTFPSQVLDFTLNSSSPVDGLTAAVENIVAMLKKQGLLSGETVSQIFRSVSKKLKNHSDESTKAERQKVNALIHMYEISTLIRVIFITYNLNPFTSVKENSVANLQLK